MKDRWRNLGRFLGLTALLEVGVVLIVGLICWIGKWWTLNAYSNGLVIAGLLLVGSGVAGIFSDVKLGGSDAIRFSSMAMRGVSDHWAARRQNVVQENQFTVLLGAVGLIAIVLGVAVTAFG